MHPCFAHFSLAILASLTAADAVDAQAAPRPAAVASLHIPSRFVGDQPQLSQVSPITFASREPRRKKSVGEGVFLGSLFGGVTLGLVGLVKMKHHCERLDGCAGIPPFVFAYTGAGLVGGGIL